MQAPAPKRAVRAAFDKAADHYDAVAAVQRAACDRLLDLATGQGFQPGRVLDAGCGTGYALPGLRRRFPAAELLALDFAPAMLRRHPAGLARPLCADLEHLPLADGCLDAIWSSYALQWCAPGRAFPELARGLRPGGQLWIATLGPGTLAELRDAFRQVDDAEHVLPFQPPEAITCSHSRRSSEWAVSSPGPPRWRSTSKRPVRWRAIQSATSARKAISSVVLMRYSSGRAGCRPPRHARRRGCRTTGCPTGRA